MTSDDGFNNVNDGAEEIYDFRATDHMRQVKSVFALQMRLYSKSVSTYIYFLVALLIPAVVYSGALDQFNEAGELLNTAYLLILLPLMIVLIPSKFSGDIMSSEFKNRTAFINFPLPMSRTSFFAGKFLAAFFMSFAVMLLALGGALISGNVYDPAYPNDVIGMLMVALSGMFALLCMTYFLSIVMGKGAGALSIAITLVVPFILLAASGDPEVVRPLTAMPMYSSYHSLLLIDSSFGNGVMAGLFPSSYSAIEMLAVSVIWGAAFLILGAWAMKLKEV